MITETGRHSSWLGWLLSLAGLVVCAYGCLGASSNRHGDTLDVSRYPSDMQSAYKVFEVRCSRCHTLARPLNARIKDPQHWVRYVERMRHNPSSGINAKNGDIIVRFLVYYMQQRELEQNGGATTEPAAPERTSPAGTDGKLRGPNRGAVPSKADEDEEEDDERGADTLAEPAESVSEPGSPEMNP